MPLSTWRHASGEVHTSTSLKFALWAGVLAGPLIWLVSLEAAYVLSYAACVPGRTWLVHAATAGPALLLAGVSVWIWVGLRPSVRHEPYDWQRWMADAGLVMSLGFILVIVATELPAFMVVPCR